MHIMFVLIPVLNSLVIRMKMTTVSNVDETGIDVVETGMDVVETSTDVDVTGTDGGAGLM